MRNRLGALVLLLTLTAGCGLLGAAGGTLLKSDVPRDESPNVSPADLDALVSGNTQFALDLYHQLAVKEGNLFVSPYSLSVALAMTYAGARGQTEQQMADALHFTLPQDHLHPAFNALALQLAARGKSAKGRGGEPFRLHVANAVWGQEDHSFLPAYLDTLSRDYGAGIRLLDFASNPDGARQQINGWVARETDDKIQNLLPSDAVGRVTRLILTNAIYFDAAWESTFRHEATRDGPFTRLDGSKVTAQMMRQNQYFPYAEGEGYQAVELPYDGGELAMVVLLPASGRFPEFERLLSASRLEVILADLQEDNVHLALPKYGFESAFRLREVLAALGMADAFGSAADFSGMDGTRDLFVQAVVHKALVRVDEEGTVAAAASAVAVTGAGPPDEPKTFEADRPFIFLIRDRETRAILFLGRVLDPTA